MNGRDGSTASLREPFERLAILLVAGRQGILEALAPPLVVRRRHDQRPAVRRDFKRGPFVDPQQFQDRSVNHQGQAVRRTARSFVVPALAGLNAAISAERRDYERSAESFAVLLARLLPCLLSFPPYYMPGYGRTPRCHTRPPKKLSESGDFARKALAICGGG
jgi:hypothetical protein